MRPQIKGSTVLVTGGAGFIGSNLVDRLLDEGAKEVVVIDNLFCGREDNLKPAIEKGAILYKDDAEIHSSLEYIFERYNIDIAVNCATKALNYSFVNPSNALTTNVTIAINLLELLRKKAFSTLCHFSTSEVFGTAVYEPMDEQHPRNPMTAYAAGKAAADIAIETYVRMYDLDAYIVRPFNNYGPRQNYLGYLAGIIPITAYRIHNGEKPQIHGTGFQSRDFIYVDDTIDAVFKLHPLIPKGENINISTDGQFTIKEVVTRICSLMDYKGEILYDKARSADVLCHNASNKKVKSMINYSLTSFDDGLKKTIEWYKKRFEEEIF
jgi:UDP-glucose 4-epimerase